VNGDLSTIPAGGRRAWSAATTPLPSDSPK